MSYAREIQTFTGMYNLYKSHINMAIAASGLFRTRSKSVGTPLIKVIKLEVQVVLSI